MFGNALAITLREHNRAQTTVTAGAIDGTWSDVADLSGLARATHVRVSQDGGPTAWKVVAGVDPHARRIHWVHPDRARRLPYDAPLTGFDPNRAILIESVEYSLLVTESGQVVRFYEGLSMIPEHSGYAPARLTLRPWVEDLATGVAQPVPPEPILVEDVRSDTRLDITGLAVDPFTPLSLVGGGDGLAALTVDDFVGAPLGPDDGLIALAIKRRGLRALEDVSEIGLLSVPDAQVRPLTINPIATPPPCVPDPCTDEPAEPEVPRRTFSTEQPPTFSSDDLFQIQAEMVLQCERLRDRFALLDAPLEAVESPFGGVRTAQEWRSRFDTQFAALAFPWLRVLDPIAATRSIGSGAAAVRAVPPSGHLAGVVAATDLGQGVHHAPANRRIEWALDTTTDVDDELHGLLNDDNINVLRTTAGRGLRVMGGRTLSSDTDWRFVSVRRFVSMVEKALEIGLQWAVFEPHDALLRARATMTATIFLLGLHEAGMLAGATPEESFFVRCDLENNPARDRDLGQLLIEIGIAPTKPLEFVLLRVGRVRDSIEVADTPSVFGPTAVGV